MEPRNIPIIDDDDDTADVVTTVVGAGPRAQPYPTTPQVAGRRHEQCKIASYHSPPQGAEGNSTKLSF